MKKNSELAKLTDILNVGTYRRVKAYEDPQRWEKMNEDERRILAQIFIKHGSERLAEQHPEAIKCFDLAAQVAPFEADVFYYKGVSLCCHDEADLAVYHQAIESFEACLCINPDHYNAWFLYGHSLNKMGIMTQETEFFGEAHEKFQQAELLIGKNEKQPSLYYSWGFTWVALAEASGEAHDYHVAFEKFQLAAEHGCNHDEFWRRFGDVSMGLASLLSRPSLLEQAVMHYQKAIACCPTSYNCIVGCALAMHKLFQVNGDTNICFQAHELYRKAHDMEQNDPFVLTRWGELNIVLGRLTSNPEVLDASIQMFKKADEISPNDSKILPRYAHGLVLSGALQEKIELLRAGEAMASRAVSLDPTNHDVWGILGNAHNELGHYFRDESFYFIAIDKYQHALTIDDKDPIIWHGLAISHFAIGDLLKDQEMIHKAINFYSRVIEFEGGGNPQFWNDWGVSFMKLFEMGGQQAHIEAAIDKFEQALNAHRERFPNMEVETDWVYNYGCALQFLGEYHDDPSLYEKAIQVLSQVVQGDPTYHFARYNLAVAFFHLGEHLEDVECLEKAVEEFQRFLTSDENEDEIAWNDWGMALMYLGDLVRDPVHPEKSELYLADAEAKLLHAIALGSTEAFYNLARIYSVRGLNQAALHYLEKAMHHDDLPEIDEMMHDTWLESVRATQEFRTLLHELHRRQNRFNG